MRYQITPGAFSYLVLELEEGESIIARPKVFQWAYGDFKIHTGVHGGLFQGISRLFGKLPIMLNQITARENKVRLALAPLFPGEIIALQLDDKEKVVVNDKTFLAAYGDIEFKAKVIGRLGIISNNLVWLELSGNGLVFLSAYGSLAKLDIENFERLTVDNRNIVAFPEDMKYKIVRLASGLKALLFGGEGIGLRFEGPGYVVVSSRPLVEQRGKKHDYFKFFF